MGQSYRLKMHLHGAEVTELELESGREYTFGRGANCDVQLEGSTSISRMHFRVFEENGQWAAQVDAKFGDISVGGQPVKHVALEPGSAFKVAAYDFYFLDPAREEPAVSSNTLPAVIDRNQAYAGHSEGRQVSNGGSLPAVIDDFEGNDEATRVMNHEPEMPFFRIVEPGGREDIYKIETRRTTAGREEGCSILLNDRKASRRQFELTSTPQGYFIRDLGSSNGTLVNGVLLAPDELRPVRSGDAIQVGKVVLHFEVRDPNFEKKLMVVPPSVRSDMPIVMQNPYEMINYPVPQGPGGAVRMGHELQTRNSGGLMARIDELPFMASDNHETKKKKRFYLIVAIVLLPIVLLFSMSGPSKPVKAPKAVNEAFLKLSPNQQQQVKESYVLAVNLYTQQKMALASDQLKKIHDVLPEGYDNSRAMATECDQAAEVQRQLEELEREKRRQEEIRRTVEATIRKCNDLSLQTYSLEAMNECLRPATDLDPENGPVKEMQARVQRRIEQREMADRDRRNTQSLVAKGRNLYEKAQALEMQGEYLDAIEAYKKHAESTYPDPANLRAESQRQVLTITKKVEARVDDSLRAAEAAYAVGNYKEALDHVLKAKKLNPRSDRAAEINGKYRRELDLKLREIYEESVIGEGLGQIDEAKARWKKIMEMDHPTGEYWKKAREKLRKYGGI